MARRSLYTYETVDKLKTNGQFRRAYARNSADFSNLTTKFIDAGRGHWRPNDEIEAAAAQGDAMALEHAALAREAHALRYRAERWFGTQPYLVK